jgi:hypothetical protein
MDDLNYLQEYLLVNYNLETSIRDSDNIFYIKNIKYFIILFIILILIFLSVIIFLKLDIKSITLLIILLFFIQKNFFRLYYYYKNISIFNKKYSKYDINNLEFKTGDIIQETVNWDNKNGFLTYLLGTEYLHNILIIKFNNINYGLHFLKSNFGYPKKILGFKSKYIEIFRLKDYFIDNDFSIKYYWLIKIKKEISNKLIFKFLQKLDMENIYYSYLINTNEKQIKTNKKYNCLSFILNILNYCKIIPNLNFQNFIPDDLIFLPKLSKSKYFYPKILKFI